MRYFFALALSCALARAQDYVVTVKDGKKVECTILEETEDRLTVTIKGKRYSVKKSDLKEWKRAPAPEGEEVKAEGETKAEEKRTEPPEVGTGVKGKVNSLVRKLAQTRTDANPVNYRSVTQQLALVLKRKDAAEYGVFLLRSGPAAARGWVALALAQAGVKEARAAAIELAKSYTPAEVPISLIEALGHFGGDDAAEALAELFLHLTAFKKLAAVTALGNTRSKWAAPLLMELVESDDARVRGAAKIALIALGRKSEAVAQKIAERAEKTEHTAEYVEMLIHLGDRSNLPFIRSMLDSEDPRVQCAAARGLGYYKDRGSAGDLLELLKERSAKTVVRVQCAASLKNIGDDSVVSGLIEILGRSGEDRRVIRAVHDTLKALTGKDLTANASIWQEAVVKVPYRARRSVVRASVGAPAPAEVILPRESRPTGPPPEVRRRRSHVIWAVMGAVFVIAALGLFVYSRTAKPGSTPRRRKKTR